MQAGRPSPLVTRCRAKACSALIPKMRVSFTDSRMNPARGLDVRMAALAETHEAASADEPQRKPKNDGKRDYIEVAEISSSHGLKGEVRVIPRTDFPVERLESVRTSCNLLVYFVTNSD